MIAIRVFSGLYGLNAPVMVVGAICGFLAWSLPSVWWICVAVTTRRAIEQDPSSTDALDRPRRPRPL